jgi:Fic family protein
MKNIVKNSYKNMPFHRHISFNDLPPLPPAVELENKTVLKKCIRAASALAELKGVGDQIPNQALLIRWVGLQEARVSSEIENIVTTTDDLYRSLADATDQLNPNAKEVLHYQDALAVGFKAIQSNRPISTSLFVDIASAIKKTDMQIRKLPGTKIETTAHEVIYTPPQGEQVIRKKLFELEQFINQERDIDPLIKLALIHYQFEAIHPFTDGNGRTGRIINILYLMQEKLLKLPILYLSKYLIEHKNDYYSGLRAVTESAEWEVWVLFMLDALEETARATANKILAVRSLMNEIGNEIRDRAPNLYSKDLVELLFYHAYAKNRFLEDAGIAKRQTASAYLKKLQDIGIVSGVKIGRENYYINRRLINLLTSD